MKRKLKIAASMLALCGAFITCPAQQSNTVVFEYDMNGNRTGQTLSSNQSKSGDTIMNNHPVTSTVLDFFKSMKVSLFPNPTYDNLTLSILNRPEELTLLFKITTSTGLVLQEKILSDDQEVFDMSGLPAGIYLFQLIAGDRKHVWKVIKE